MSSRSSCRSNQVVRNACERSLKLSRTKSNQTLIALGTLHDMRFVIFDNDTRLLFASTFDGDWDVYINDFATIIPDQIDFDFEEVEGYPGIHSPNIKDFIVKHQVSATSFYSAYPNATVRDVWKALKIKDALNNLLDEAAK
jgi:hypothetical protein